MKKFFHKVKMVFVRACGTSIPDIDEAKRYGNDGEDEFICMLRRELPFCKIKRNIFISTPGGNAEIDCLVLYDNKLFAIEIKSWKGCLTEQGDNFIQEKTDFNTGETYTKFLASPFKQLKRAIYLLKKQNSINAWINDIVFFGDDELESVSVSSGNVWFNSDKALVNYIRNDGKTFFGTTGHDLFEKCVPADFLYSNTWDNSLHCIINRDTLRFETPQGAIPTDNIVSINISHRLCCDELHIKLVDNAESVIDLGNGKIQVDDNGCVSTYSLSKLDYIELGRTLLP